MEQQRVALRALHPLITCKLCQGYLIDPVTLSECLHSFCKTCILKSIKTNKKCPICDIPIHKTKPHVNLRKDKTLQDIVYKLIPGLHADEMQRRERFLGNRSPRDPEVREYKQEKDRIFFCEEDKISLSVEYFDAISPNQRDFKESKRYLRCPGMFKIRHLKKFISTKYGLKEDFVVDIIYKDDIIPDEYTLIDVASLYNWRKDNPMKFFYRIFHKTTTLLRRRKRPNSAELKKDNEAPPAKKHELHKTQHHHHNVPKSDHHHHQHHNQHQQGAAQKTLPPMAYSASSSSSRGALPVLTSPTGQTTKLRIAPLVAPPPAPPKAPSSAPSNAPSNAPPPSAVPKPTILTPKPQTAVLSGIKAAEKITSSLSSGASAGGKVEELSLNISASDVKKAFSDMNKRDAGLGNGVSGLGVQGKDVIIRKDFVVSLTKSKLKNLKEEIINRQLEAETKKPLPDLVSSSSSSGTPRPNALSSLAVHTNASSHQDNASRIRFLDLKLSSPSSLTAKPGVGSKVNNLAASLAANAIGKTIVSSGSVTSGLTSASRPVIAAFRKEVFLTKAPFAASTSTPSSLVATSTTTKLVPIMPNIMKPPVVTENGAVGTGYKVAITSSASMSTATTKDAATSLLSKTPSATLPTLSTTVTATTTTPSPSLARPSSGLPQPTPALSYGEKQLAAAGNAHAIRITKDAMITKEVKITLDKLQLPSSMAQRIGSKQPLSFSTSSLGLPLKTPPAVNPLPQNQSVRTISNPSLLTKEKTVEAAATPVKIPAPQQQEEKQEQPKQPPPEQEKEVKA